MPAPTVLLVDDEPDILASFRFVLERGLPGARVLSAASGEEGLAVLRQERVDVILSDYKMRGMDGLDFLAAARALAPQARCVLVTAYPEGDMAFLRLRDMGAAGLLPKPCTAEAMLRAVSGAAGGTLIQPGDSGPGAAGGASRGLPRPARAPGSAEASAHRS